MVIVFHCLCPAIFCVLINTHLFIHIKHLYSASSRELLRGTPDSSMAKKNIHTYTPTYIHTYIQYINTYIHTYIHTYVHSHTYLHKHIHVCAIGVMFYSSVK